MSETGCIMEECGTHGSKSSSFAHMLFILGEIMQLSISFWRSSSPEPYDTITSLLKSEDRAELWNEASPLLSFCSMVRRIGQACGSDHAVKLFTHMLLSSLDSR
eukprot:TRINITY_DN77395_c0_g1_i1.p1 TRINITY_DN77395_c0_g1~~TRINITY_DN77395_c0_g1_i1.p1  ORF type:complete len:104 (+),score=6.04 TRINITY_DN77395_c0_g1_i1:28-339(+)